LARRTTLPRDGQSSAESEHCERCGAPVCGRQRVISEILGGKGNRLCLRCLGESLSAEPEQLCALVGKYLARRECYRNDWQAARVCDEDGRMPCCPSRLENSAEPPSWYQPELFRPASAAALPEAELRVDAEEAGCGDLMVLLMRSIRKLKPGEVLALTARDPGAEADIPSWCRLTGHTLLAGPAEPEAATYYIRRKESLES
jgi:tRNA 2-thiouridine synthesizing protein A